MTSYSFVSRSEDVTSMSEDVTGAVLEESGTEVLLLEGPYPMQGMEAVANQFGADVFMFHSEEDLVHDLLNECCSEMLPTTAVDDTAFPLKDQQASDCTSRFPRIPTTEWFGNSIIARHCYPTDSAVDNAAGNGTVANHVYYNSAAEVAYHAAEEASDMAGTHHFMDLDNLFSVIASQTESSNQGIDQASSFEDGTNGTQDRTNNTSHDSSLPTDTPKSSDVCFGLMDFPGTNEWRAILRANVDQEWSIELYDKVRCHLAGRRYWSCHNETWHPASEAEIFQKTQQRFRDSKKQISRTTARNRGRPPSARSSRHPTPIVAVDDLMLFLDHDITTCLTVLNHHNVPENQHYWNYRLRNLELLKQMIVDMSDYMLHSPK